ncbi:methyltransferase domain-containing protein [Candidatus Woesearchaeota archaeon]|nr:methyltransferase domain-containing protein [Candidatus Woesearchaeota archaeon]
MDQQQARTFEKISNLYDKARTSYPPQLINDIIAYSGIKQNGMILDVGCGTGQATFLFAQRDYNVVGLDAGQEMVTIAIGKCSSFPKVSFKVGTFEEIEFPDSSIDIIASGMAWHWINPEVAEKKTYEILRNGGTLALFWSHQQKEKSDFVKAVGNVLDKYGGIERGPAGSRVKQISDNLYERLKLNKLFTSVEMREYNENIEFSKERYLNLIISYGWVQILPENKKKDLTDDLQKLFKKYEEPLIIPYKYMLVLAKKS